MSEPTPSTDPNAVRVVFFGPPRSGKSRLLAAVAKHAGAGAEDAPVDLTPAHDTAAARRDLIPLELLVDLPGPRAESGAVLFIDCDGQAAHELLTHADRLMRTTARSALADAVRSADALVLVIDSEWKEGEVEETFRGFAEFLNVLESTRTADREVGGLPVFLTLAKCDTLHRPGERFTDWEGHIDLRKRELRQRFDDAFDDGGQTANGFLSFGSTDVRLAATATQMPADESLSPYADESGGFGVTDLFDELFAAARDHRDRAIRSGKRLRWTAGLAVGLFAALLLTLLGLTAAGEPGPVEVLSNRARRFQQTEGPPPVRLAEENLDRNRREVAALRDSPEFDRLPRDLREFVADRDREFAAYADYHRRFQPPQFAPADVRTHADFARLGGEMAGPLAPPPEYEQAWAGTEMLRLREKWRTDLDLLRRAEEEVHDWFRARITRGGELLLANVPGDKTPQRWRAEVTDTLNQSPPFREDDPVPGSAALPVRRGAELTYATAFRFERSANAVRDWQLVSSKLADVRDLADALGLTQNPELTTRPGEPSSVLDLPPPGEGVDSLTLAATRLELLRARYPRAADGTANWAAANLSGSLRDELGKRLRLSAADGVAHVQRLIRTELGRSNGRGQAAADWAGLADRGKNGLLLKPELQAWGRLLRLLLRWADPARPDTDPVAELVAFVSRDRFTWNVSKFEVVLPNSLKVRVLKPADDLKLTVVPANGAARTSTFERAGSPNVEADGVTYQFAPKNGVGPVVVAPLDGFRAELALTDGDTKYLLRWADARTPVFQFDALTREPTIEAVGQNAVPQRANGVRVIASPPGVGLAVPELLPDMR